MEPPAAAAAPQATVRARDVVVVTALALGANLVAIGSKSLWLDEATSVHYALMGPRTVLGETVLQDPNSVLYYALLSLWLKVFGAGEVAVRVPSALCATLTAPVACLIGTRLFGRATGLLAGVLVALSAFIVFYGQTVRGYALLAFLVSVATWCFVVDLERPSRLAKATYVLAASLAFYAHHFAALAIAAHAVALLVLQGKKAVSRDNLAVAVAVAILCAPMVILAAGADSGGLFWLTRPGVAELGRLFTEYAGRDLPLLALLAGASIVALTAARREGRATGVVVVAAWLLVPIALSFAVSQARPLFYPRYLIASAPPFFLLAAAGLTRLRPRALTWAGATVAVLLSGAALQRFYREDGREAWREAVAYVREKARPGDAVVFVPYYVSMPFQYYARLGGGPDLEDLSLKPAMERRRVWVVVSPSHVRSFADKLGALRRSFSSTHHLEATTSFRRVDVEYYVR